MSCGGRDADTALAGLSRVVADWSGGTRLGSDLKDFLDRYGQRGAARGAVVVVASDGWERGDTTVLAEQMPRLHRLAHRVVWVQPAQGPARLRAPHRRDGRGVTVRRRSRRRSQPGGVRACSRGCSDQGRSGA